MDRPAWRQTTDLLTDLTGPEAAPGDAVFASRGQPLGGKAVRGAKGKDGKGPHLVAALAHGIGAVLGQSKGDAREAPGNVARAGAARCWALG